MTLDNMRYLLILNNEELLDRMDEINMSISLIIEANNDLFVTDEQVQEAITETLNSLKKEDVGNDS